VRVRSFMFKGPPEPARVDKPPCAPAEPREQRRSGVFDVVPTGAHAAHLEPTTVRRAAEYAFEQRFTSREREVFFLMIGGFDTKEIAARIGIAHATVRTHCLRMREKSSCPSDRAMIAHFARRTAEYGHGNETEDERSGAT
jgi:DNA-binding CsgD family transcriptional regulator